MKNVPDTVPVNVQLSPDIIWKVWARGEIFAGNDPVFWRRDVCGAWIFRSHYNRKDSEYGWVIDRINPTLEGDADTISNLRPVHWENTIRKADGSTECRITSDGVHNGKPTKNEPITELQNIYHINF